MHIMLLLMLIILIASVSQCCGLALVCYYSSWANYRRGTGRLAVEDLDPHLCTHLVYGKISESTNYTVYSLAYTGKYRRYILTFVMFQHSVV